MSNTDSLETPRWLFDQLDWVFSFKLDACASDRNHLVKQYFTEENSCLDKSWRPGPVFLNPPYSNPAPFLKKACDETSNGVTTVALIKGDPSTKWWNSYVADAADSIIWIPNRIRFHLNGKPTKHMASFPSVLAIYLGITWRPDALEQAD